MAELYLDLDRRLRMQRIGKSLQTALERSGHPILEQFHFVERGVGDVPWTALEQTEDSLRLTSIVEDRWRITAEISLGGRRCPRAVWEISATWLGVGAHEAAFDAVWRARIANAEPFVPGIFYGENRPAGGGHSPRWTPEAAPEDPAASSGWRFRADRTMTPVAILRDRDSVAAILVPERFSHGLTGLGFEAGAKSGELSAHFPYREEPFRYTPFLGVDNGPASPAFTVHSGETVHMRFEIYTGFTGWRPLLRDLYNDAPGALHPWMPGDQAAELAAQGLYDWHFDPDNAVLYETAGFDRYFRTAQKQWDRKHMHIAWVSGAPYAFALAQHGGKKRIPEMVDAGLAVLDKIAAEAVSPSGVFYPQWTEEDGWCGGWTSDDSLPPVAQSRTVGEATWFFMQALAAPENWAVGDRWTHWVRAVQSNLDYVLSVQREDGNLGTYYNLETGSVEEWSGAGGMMWIPALLMAGRYVDRAGAEFPNAAKYLDAAFKAGDYYASMVRTEKLAGAPEDVPYGATSEDGYNALISMLRLYEDSGDEKWLDLAQHAADYALSFRMSYNTFFPESTLLGRYDFRSKGADIASPANQHLHNYGYICLPALLRLWRITGDDYLFQRARDQVFCFRQFIARADGDFNARKGMVPEQWFHTDWTHPKGCVLPLAHSWCAGWIVWVEDWLQTFGTLFVDPVHHKVSLLESVDILDENWAGGTITLRNPWSRDVEVQVLNTATEERATYHLPANETHLYQLHPLLPRPVT
jgi:hypothetical protein